MFWGHRLAEPAARFFAEPCGPHTDAGTDTDSYTDAYAYTYAHSYAYAYTDSNSDLFAYSLHALSVHASLSICK